MINKKTLSIICLATFIFIIVGNYQVYGAFCTPDAEDLPCVSCSHQWTATTNSTDVEKKCNIDVKGPTATGNCVIKSGVLSAWIEWVMNNEVPQWVCDYTEKHKKITTIKTFKSAHFVCQRIPGGRFSCCASSAPTTDMCKKLVKKKKKTKTWDKNAGEYKKPACDEDGGTPAPDCENVGPDECA